MTQQKLQRPTFAEDNKIPNEWLYKILASPVLIILWLIQFLDNICPDIQPQQLDYGVRSGYSRVAKVNTNIHIYDKRTGKTYLESIPPYPEDESL